MKIKTRILTAVLATATAFSCALTASALQAAPTLSLQGNESTPATLENGAATATLTLKSSDFSAVKGAKIKVTLPDGITFKSDTVAITGTTNGVLNKNFAVSADNKTITLVDVFNMDGTPSADLKLTFKFDVEATRMGTYQVKVTGNFADLEEGTKDTEQTANLVISREFKTMDASSITVEDGYFIPAYGAYTGDKSSPTYLEKATNGSIAAGEGNATVLKCKLPNAEVGITTFGASKSTIADTYSNNTIQFGSYVNYSNSNEYGTLLIAGDFDDMVDYYLTNKSSTYSTAKEVVARIMRLIDRNNVGYNTYVKFKYDGTNAVYVAKIKRNTYMWKNADEIDNATQLQYALRVYDIPEANKNTNYTAIGYSLSGTEYKFSTEVKTATLAGLN